MLTTIFVGELLLETKNNVSADIYVIKAEKSNSYDYSLLFIEQELLSARIIAQVSSKF